MLFRKDINGLRAFAVIAVVLYHFGVPGMQGGFIGVDVFFVISGYLMTSIVFNDIERNKFSWVRFCLSRARRIIPALAFLCVTTLVLGWFILLPSEYEALGKHAASAVFFVSNIAFWTEAGYFDTASHEKWLLHTWSLSVEWQFYLLYPLAILLIGKIVNREATRHILAATCLISFILSIYASHRWPGAAFYMLPTRAWEMIAGGLIFLYPFDAKETQKKALESAGVAAIIFSALFFSAEDIWPGWLASIPVAGTMMVIMAARQNSLLTSNAAAQKVGEISYSVYLWHWPVIVLISYYDLDNSPLWITTGIASSIAFGYLSYALIETPFKKAWQANGSLTWPVLKPLLLVSTVGLAGFAIQHSGGAPTPLRVNDIVVAADQERFNRNPRSKDCTARATNQPQLKNCIFGGDQKNVRLIVIGDSHSSSTINAVAESLPKDQGGALYLGADGCMSLVNINTKFFPNCGEYNKLVLDFLESHHPGIPVLIINRTTAAMRGKNEPGEQQWTQIENVSMNDPGYSNIFSEQYLKSTCAIAKSHPIFIMKPLPEMEVDIPKAMIKTPDTSRLFVTISTYEKRHMQTMQMLSRASSECGAKLLDPTPTLCKDGKCFGSENGRPLYYDSNHLSEHGNRKLVPIFKQIWL